jgi:hypothetical protein
MNNVVTVTITSLQSNRQRYPMQRVGAAVHEMIACSVMETRRSEMNRDYELKHLT